MSTPTPQALDYANEELSSPGGPTSVMLPDLLRLLCLMPFLEGMGGVYDREQVCGLLAKKCERVGVKSGA